MSTMSKVGVICYSLLLFMDNAHGNLDTIDIHQQLTQSRESLEFALQSAGMGTWDIDLTHDQVRCSDEMLRLWEISPAEFKGQRSQLQAKVHPVDLDGMRSSIEAAIKNRTIYELEYRLSLGNGRERWVKSRGRCTYAPDSTEPIRLSGVVFDITERKSRELALELAIREREQFLTIANHELRTPLTCLLLQHQVLEWELKENLGNLGPTERISSIVDKQKEQLGRLTRIVENIFEQSNIADGRFNLRPLSFNLVPVVTEIVDRFNGVINTNPSGLIRIIVGTEIINGYWDQFRIEQVMINLITNALRFGKNKPVMVEVAAYGGKAIIKVKDSGDGIRKEDQERIFERFGRSSLEADMSGMGLGLYLAKSIIHSHGGEISLKSEPGQGSEFTVTLPL